MLQTNTNLQINKYNKRLEQFSKNGIPFAASATLNNLAFKARKEATRQFEKDHIIRSNWTQRGMLFQKTRSTIPIRKMESRMGNIRPYAKILERGGTITADNKYLEVPTAKSRVSKNIKKRVATRFKLSKIGKVRRLSTTGKTVKQKFALMLKKAREDRFYGPFLIEKNELNGERLPTGIFYLIGAGKQKMGGGSIVTMRHLKKSQKIKKNSFIEVAGVRSANAMDKLYIRNAKRILKKYGRDIR